MGSAKGTADRRWRRSTPEVRWFGRGAPPTSPRGKVRRRIDSYHLASLNPARSVKQRGTDGPLEMKVRIGAVERRSYDGVVAFAERWVKRTIRGRREALRHATWIEVDKMIWQDRGLQLAIVRVGDDEWWSMVMPDATQPSKPASKWMSDHADVLAEAMSCSFPTWLLHRNAVREAGQAS
jgi:hypothetical protein